MKTKLPLTLLLSFSFYLLSSQIPQGFNYQAIARDGTTGNPISDPIDVKIAILSDDDPETIIREEQFTGVDPDEHGLFSIVVGQGSWVSGLTNFSDIDWTVTPKYIKTLIWYGGEWKDMGPAQLWSVPYAMYSPSTNPWSLNGSSLYYSGGNVGIGITSPADLLHVNGNTIVEGMIAGRYSSGYGYVLQVGNDSRIVDINIANTLGIYGITDETQGHIRLGSNGPVISGKNGNVGIGTITPNAKLQVNGDIYLPYNSGNSVLSISMGSGNTMFFKPEDNLIRIQSDHTGSPTIMTFDKSGNVGVGGKFGSIGMEIGGPAPNATNGQATLYLHHWGSIAHQLRYTSGTLYFEAAGNGYGTTQTPALQIGGDLYAAVNGGKVGIGTTSSSSKMAIQPALDWSDEIPLFEVKNKYGIPVLAVYNNGVKINIEHDPDGVKGPKGGFNIGGYDYTKGGTYTLMNVTPDSIRFNINNGTSKGPKGGFAIGGFGVTKGDINEDFMYITPQSSNGGNYNAKMGFEAGKNSAGPHNTYMGVQAGKGVTGSTAASNIFIGEGSGMNNSGSYMSYLLILPGGGTTTAFNSWGGENVAVGNYTGVGLYGTFLHQSYGQRNVLIGHYTGFNLTTGSKNVIIGNSAGLDLVSGNGNIFLGYNAGSDELGSNKLYIANSSTSSPLIYGDYDLNYARINGDFYVTVEAYKPGGGEWVASSDIRLKNVLEPFKKGLTEVLGLNPVFYNYKEGNSRNLPSTNEYIGFVAQDVQQYIPEAVSTGKDGYLNLDMHVINVALVNAVKEQQRQIESQQEQINRLEKLVEKVMEQK
jgi:hypothetical protein